MRIARRSGARIALAAAAAILVALAIVLLTHQSDGGPPSPAGLPKGFFGVAPQTPLVDADLEYMRAGGIETIRMPFAWSTIEPTAEGGYDWSTIDPEVELAARYGVQILPFLAGTPEWIGPLTQLPVFDPDARRAWSDFVSAAARRYGPGGEFWSEHASTGPHGEPPILRPLPIRTWQIWNEVNFFYFAYPVSAPLYGQLLKLSAPALRSVDPGAKIVLSGLFGEPAATGKKGVNSATFLRRLYRVPGIKADFDDVALHPYAVDVAKLEGMVEAMHQVTVENGDHVGLLVTEMGWGSQDDPEKDAFEQGEAGQAEQLAGAYEFLIDNQRRFDLRQVDWFSWKDAEYLCDFCDSVGFFRGDSGFRPKPAWRAFVEVTGGRERP